MEMLAALVRQRTAWQITGMKGPKDGRGYQYENARYQPMERIPGTAAPTEAAHHRGLSAPDTAAVVLGDDDRG